MKNNDIETIQTTLMEELERLNKNNVDATEVSRSNAISNIALTYIKAENLKIRIAETTAVIHGLDINEK